MKFEEFFFIRKDILQNRTGFFVPLDVVQNTSALIVFTLPPLVLEQKSSSSSTFATFAQRPFPAASPLNSSFSSRFLLSEIPRHYKNHYHDDAVLITDEPTRLKKMQIKSPLHRHCCCISTQKARRGSYLAMSKRKMFGVSLNYP